MTPARPLRGPEPPPTSPPHRCQSCRRTSGRAPPSLGKPCKLWRPSPPRQKLATTSVQAVLPGSALPSASRLAVLSLQAARWATTPTASKEVEVPSFHFGNLGVALLAAPKRAGVPSLLVRHQGLPFAPSLFLLMDTVWEQQLPHTVLKVVEEGVPSRGAWGQVNSQAADPAAARPAARTAPQRAGAAPRTAAMPSAGPP
mmetsp:Transcript_113907/g.362164  ORF Transcript_113907/g.362164 Transcript_113907/m.362164 type:complete len:200 (+) Transcript_113907:1070-1669(+)